MKNNLSKYFIRKFITTKNIIHIIINSFLILIVLLCLTIIKLSNDFYKATTNGIEGRTLVLPESTDLNLIKNNKSIIFASEGKYRFGYNFDFNEINYIYIKPLLDENHIKMIDGHVLKEKGDMICPKKLYPYEYSLNMDFSKTIDSKSLFDTHLSNGKYNFNVVGTYTNIQMEEANVCYISVNDFSLFDIDSYNQKMIVYDKKENYNSITDFLDNNNISYINPITFDESYVYLKTIPIYILSIVIIIILNIAYSFAKKNINNNNKIIGLLRAFGEQKKFILLYFLIAHIILISISILVSIIVFFAIYSIIQPYLTEFMYYNLYINLPISYTLIFILIFYLFIVLIIKHLLNKKFKIEINNLLEKNNKA